MTEEKHPADRVVELFVFAPVGLALSAKDLLPELVERGRRQLGTQVTLARMLGEYAVKQGQTEAGKAFERAREQALATLEQLGIRGDGPGALAPRPGAGTGPVDADAAPATGVAGTAAGRPADVPTKGATTAPSPEPVPVEGPPIQPTGPAPRRSAPRRSAPPRPAAAPAPPGELAIPDYDSLSASQVLPRLSGLDRDELEAVRAHEAANRGRKTILNKVAQLQGT